MKNILKIQSKVLFITAVLALTPAMGMEGRNDNEQNPFYYSAVPQRTNPSSNNNPMFLSAMTPEGNRGQYSRENDLMSRSTAVIPSPMGQKKDMGPGSFLEDGTSPHTLTWPGDMCYDRDEDNSIGNNPFQLQMWRLVNGVKMELFLDNTKQDGLTPRGQQANALIHHIMTGDQWTRKNAIKNASTYVLMDAFIFMPRVESVNRNEVWFYIADELRVRSEGNSEECGGPYNFIKAMGKINQWIPFMQEAKKQGMGFDPEKQPPMDEDDSPQ